MEEQRDTMGATEWGRNTHTGRKKKQERGRPSGREGGLFRGEKNRATETAMEPEEEGRWATVSPLELLTEAGLWFFCWSGPHKLKEPP